jgi:hypothetical protein
MSSPTLRPVVPTGSKWSRRRLERAKGLPGRRRQPQVELLEDRTLLSSANQALVGQLYQDLLQRPADAAGLSGWTAALDQGARPVQVALAIAQSAEGHRQHVQSLYQQFLHRRAEPFGLEAFTAVLAAGQTREQVAAAVVASPEYYQDRAGGSDTGFLYALYQDALNRPVDTTGAAAFGQALAGGTTRARVAEAVFTSAEYRQNLVQHYYQSYLHRAAEAGGLASWVTALQQGTRDEQVIAGIVGSAEYALRSQQPAGGSSVVSSDSPTAVSWKDSVRVATTGPIMALTGTPTIDGVALGVGDRVLVKDQMEAKENGIYVVAMGPWSRAADANDDSLVTPEMAVRVSEGDINAHTEWFLTTKQMINLGVTPLVFAPLLPYEIPVKWFGAKGDDVTDDTAAIQAAINVAQNSGRNASVVLGGGIFRVNATLNINFAGANKGISIIGSPWASLQQGSALPASTVRWVGGAAPVFNVTSTFTDFIGFSIVNNGAATNGIKFTPGGHTLLFEMSFQSGGSLLPFSDAAVLFQGFDYTFIDRCNFETSPAVKLTNPPMGLSSTTEITRSVFDANDPAAKPLLYVDAQIELLKIERNTFNLHPNVNVVFDNCATTNNIYVMRVVANEFDGDSQPNDPSKIIRGKNIFSLTFDDNAVEQFPGITGSLIELTNSQARVSGNWGYYIMAPLVKTLDTASRVFVGPNNFKLGDPGKTLGILDNTSSAGIVTLTPNPATTNIPIHGNYGDPGGDTTSRFDAPDNQNDTVYYSKPTDPPPSPGYMTRGQKVTVMIRNMSGGPMGTITFDPAQFKMSGAFPSPANGMNRSIGFVFDGTYMVETWRTAADVPN